jgi:hypothetical protein
MKKRISFKKGILWLCFAVTIEITSMLGNFASNAFGIGGGGHICPPCKEWNGSSCTGCECGCHDCNTTANPPYCESKCDNHKCEECVSCTIGCKVCSDRPCETCENGVCKVCAGRICQVCDNGKCKSVKIKSQTAVILPLDRARTELGIGEIVYCHTEPSAPVYWEIIGDGFIYPSGLRSSGVAFMAPMKPSNETLSIQLEEGGYTCDTKTFEVKAPNRETVSFYYNLDEIGIHGPPNNKIGFSSIFRHDVQPSTVNFSSVLFRENIPYAFWTWPDGTDDSWYPEQITYTLIETESEYNFDFDWCEEYFHPISQLRMLGVYYDHCHIIQIKQEYLNEDQIWIQWLDSSHDHSFSGSDQSAHVTCQYSNTASSDPMGPWQ